MTDREALDERMRSKLRALADAEPRVSLDDAARARVIEGARRELARRARMRVIGVVAAGLAAAAALWLVASPQAASWIFGAPSAGEDASIARVDPAPSRCAAWDPVASDALEGEGPWSLGARGVVRADGARVRLGERAPCRTELSLEEGTVVVRADDLGDGELIVLAGSRRVRVTGTLFSVTRGDDEAVSVWVAEGHVELHTVASPGAPIAIDGGEVATARADQVTVERADEAALQTLRAAFDEPTIVEEIDPTIGDGASGDGASEGADRGAVHEGSEETAPAERVDPVALAIEAERLYRSGELEGARAAFRRAGASSESAALRWARLELDAGALDAARMALALHARRHRRGALGAEAAFLGLELAEARGDAAGARAAATAIIERYPGTPQARAAERRLAH